MDLSLVPEIGPQHARTLGDAGVRNAEGLAAYEDLQDLAARSGIAPERLESFREAARAAVERLLTEAGVMDPGELAAADVAALSAQTGLDVDYLSRYQETARGYLRRMLEDLGLGDDAALAAVEDVNALSGRSGIAAHHLTRYRDAARTRLAQQEAALEAPPAPAPIEPVPEPVPVAAIADEADRVVLVDGAPVARVRAGGRLYEGVSLVIAGPQDADDVLARAGGDAVLLRAQADAVSALVGGSTHHALPLFKERRVEDRVEEVRVRVAEIRDVPEKRAGMLGRFFRRK